MGDYVTLLGAETVGKAAFAIGSAAEVMTRSADTIDSALSRFNDNAVPAIERAATAITEAAERMERAAERFADAPMNAVRADHAARLLEFRSERIAAGDEATVTGVDAELRAIGYYKDPAP